MDLYIVRVNNEKTIQIRAHNPKEAKNSAEKTYIEIYDKPVTSLTILARCK